MTRKISIYMTDKLTGEIFVRYHEIITFDGVLDSKRLNDFFAGFKRQLIKRSNILIQMESEPYTPPIAKTLF